MEFRANGDGDEEYESLTQQVQKSWTAPILPSGPLDGLKVFNTLSGSKVLFQTADGSRNVTWYNCGPTVYDSSHVGHARNYLTFDILRRILEDYFGYKVLYVMNVTDVDDKIINRARRNYLLDQYRVTASDPIEVYQDLAAAFEVEICKQQQKLIDAQEERAASTSSQQKKLDERVKQEELKLSKLKEAEKGTKDRAKQANSLQGKTGVDFLLSDNASDVLASQLDTKLGAEVTDHAIFRAHSSKYEKDFFDDMSSLGVKPPDAIARVTEYIDLIIQYIRKIVDQGFAYHANGSVYFDTRAFIDAGHTYGKLNPWAVGSAGLASESETNFESKDKKSSTDFALWKVSKRGEPFWESPWGLGRPGWHIECSAMASDIIGRVIDVHSGGNDLQFPHHDNELAQAEAYYGCSQWVNYFLHSGHLAINGLKMSKSLKNFITIKQALATYSARQLRLLFVIQAWDKPMTFSDDVMVTTITKEKKFKTFFDNVEIILRQTKTDDNQRWSENEKNLTEKLRTAEIQVRKCLEDNFDTPGALDLLLDLVKDVNVYREKVVQLGRMPKTLVVRRVAVYVTSVLSVFGLSDAGKDEIGWGSVSSGVADRGSILAPYLDSVVSFRDAVRSAAKEGSGPMKEKILALADQFRDYNMVELGVRLEDRVDGSTWKLEDDPDVLRKERDEKLQKAMDEKLSKLGKTRERQIREIDKWEPAARDPVDLFKGRVTDFSAFGDDGMPTHDSKGLPITASSKKKLKKEMDMARKLHEELKQKLAADPKFLEGLRNHLTATDQEISKLKTPDRFSARIGV